MALGLGDVVSDAANGENTFADGALEICSLGNMYNNFVHAFTTGSTGITSVDQMKGKRIAVGAVGSASEVTADRILEAAGINPQSDITRVQLGVAEAVDALKDGTVDAAFWSGGLPTGAVTDLASTGDLVVGRRTPGRLTTWASTELTSVDLPAPVDPPTTVRSGAWICRRRGST